MFICTPMTQSCVMLLISGQNLIAVIVQNIHKYIRLYQINCIFKFCYFLEGPLVICVT